MRKLSHFDTDMLSATSELFLSSGVTEAVAFETATAVQIDAAALSLEMAVEMGYHTPSLGSDASASASSSKYDVLDIGAVGCCACSSCAQDAELTMDGSGGIGLNHHYASLTGSDGYQLPSMEFAEMSSSLTFTLNDTGGVGVGSDAEAGFLAAADAWISFLADAVNVRLDVGFASLNPGVLGSAGSNRADVAYDVFVAALMADGTSADDALAIANLQMGPALDIGTQDANGDFILDNDGSANNSVLFVQTSTLRALGIITDINGDPIDDGVTADATITFNSDFVFDFDPTDGIDAGAIDFFAVAFHEIGHALGFTSGVDILDINPGLDLNPFGINSALDVFRYSNRASELFGEGTLDWGWGGDAFFSIDGGITNLGGFSTGRNFGDGQQASHWKDNLGLGIMDPTAEPAGTAGIITGLDIRAMDVIGWDLVGADKAVNLYDANGFLVQSYDTLQTAENQAMEGGRVAADAGSYAANSETVNVNVNNLTFLLTDGVTPNIRLIQTAENITLAGEGDGNIEGNALDNTIIGNQGDNTLLGRGGDDLIDGGRGDDILDGDSGVDTVSYASSSERVVVDLGAGTAIGVTSGTDTLANFENAIGGSGDDRMTGSDIDNILTGGLGADILLGAEGNDTLYGDINGPLFISGISFGSGIYVRPDDASNNFFSSAIDISDFFSLDSDVNIENSTTIPHVSIFADGDPSGANFHIFRVDLNGAGIVLTLDIDFGFGGAGDLDTFIQLRDSTFTTVDFNDSRGTTDPGSTSDLDAFIQYTTLAADTYFIIVGQDGFTPIPADLDYVLQVSVDESNVITAGGDDRLVGGAGDDSLFGEDGDDALLGGVDNDLLFGGSGDDTLSGQSGDDTLDGASGEDSLSGASGDDIISGGDGNDIANGGGGDDTINGDAGDDVLNGAIGEDTILGGAGNDTIFGNNQDDNLFGNGGDDIIDGGAGNDTMTGGGGNDTFVGSSGQDTMYGQSGNDSFSGGAGGDDLFGGDGNDLLNGGGGNDDMNGGAGADVFVASTGFGVDRIQDFENGIDLVDFSGHVLANNIGDVLAVASQAGANVRIDLNPNNVLILEGFDLADLDASDFIF